MWLQTPWIRRLPLLVLLLGPASVQAQTGTVVVEVQRAEARNRNTDTFFGNRQDFFPLVSIAGGPFDVGPVRDGRDVADMDLSAAAAVAAGDRFYPLTIVLREEDDTSSDDTFDIDPTPGSDRLNLQFDACTMTLLNTAPGSTMGLLGPGPVDVPFGFGDGKQDGDGPGADGPDFDARVRIEVTTDTGLPFFEEADVAIVDFSPVQAAHHPSQIIADKPMAFMVELASGFPGDVEAKITVNVTDGITPATRERVVLVPGGVRQRFFLFDASPYVPGKLVSDPTLRFDIHIDVSAEDASSPDRCVANNNDVAGASLPIIKTADPFTVYRAFDVVALFEDPNLPNTAQLDAMRGVNETFRANVFPLASTNVARDVTPFVSLVPTTDLTADWIELWKAGFAAQLAGIDRLVLVPLENELDEIGMNGARGSSLSEFAPHAVFADHMTAMTTAHELGHTFRLSQRNCTTGGLAEFFLSAGCRDEATHAGSPFIAEGFDVTGTVFPTGAAGAPGTREVSRSNLMDIAPNPEAFTRWIDAYTFDLLAEALEVRQDPEMLHLWGEIHTLGGLAAGGTPLGILRNAHAGEGIPDFALPPAGGFSGSGRFELRVFVGNEVHRYRFDPGYPSERDPDNEETGVFAFSVEAPGAPDGGVERVELWGPADLGDPESNADALLDELIQSAAAPLAEAFAAGIDVAPDLSNPPAAPPIFAPGSEVVIAWSLSDQDGDEPTVALMLQPPPLAGSYDGLQPWAVDLVDGEFRIPHAWLSGRPGVYGGQIHISDGLNSTVASGPLFALCDYSNSGVEICDGLDNDCDGVVDNTSTPGRVTGLTADRNTVSWAPLPSAESYDVILGSLVQLREERSFSGAECRFDGIGETQIDFDQTPAAGDSYWILVRGENCSGSGSYDSAGPGQVEPRDDSIQTSGSACP